MRIAIVAALVAIVGPAYAAPLSLICSGTLELRDNKKIPFDRETVTVDLEARTIKPPFYPAFPITIVRENSITFGSELPTISTWGGLDRVSGKMSLNALPPADRKTLMSGGTVFFHALMDAQCVPARRMF